MQENNYLGKEPVGKLLLQFAIPSTLALVIMCLYNIVDQIFVGMRPLVNEGQVIEYLELASTLEPQVFHSKKTTELTAHYRAALSSCKLEDCLLLIKEISTKQKELASHNKKLGPVDEQYLKLAERLVCEEFAAVLRTTPDAAKKRLYTEMRRKKSGARKVALRTAVL